MLSKCRLWVFWDKVNGLREKLGKWLLSVSLLVSLIFLLKKDVLYIETYIVTAIVLTTMYFQF